MNCWSCAKPVDAADHYCRHCGQGQGSYVSWYYHPLAIAFLTVFLMGPFSLVLVWKSPGMSSRGRWVATALILAFTVYLGYSLVVAFRVFRGIFAGDLGVLRAI